MLVGVSILLGEIEKYLESIISIASLLGVMTIGFIIGERIPKIGIIILATGLIGRSIGVLISLIGTDLNWKERMFSIIAYTPKATVQAAIGAVPLSLGIKSGSKILAIAVLSILITAPLGSIGINSFGDKLLENK